jgi:hypothetical protein
MSLSTMELLEVGALFVSFLTVIFAGLVLVGAWHDWQDAKAAGVAITEQANEMARERLVTGLFLFWMATCLLVSGVYSIILLETSPLVEEWAAPANRGIAVQAFMLRSFWRVSVLGFAFVRWSTRERIRRELLVK